MSVTSTIPGAVAVLAGYLQTVADAQPQLGVGVYTGGLPVEHVADNLLMVGSITEEGEIIVPGTYRWAAIPGAAKLRTEEYALRGSIRCWAGDSDPLSRLTDAFSLLNGVHQQILDDVGGSGALSPSGSWGELQVSNPLNGPIGRRGWGVVLEFDLHVINAQLQG